MPGYSKTDSKYPITGREGAEIYAIYRTGSRAGGKADGLVDVPEKLPFLHQVRHMPPVPVFSLNQTSGVPRPSSYPIHGYRYS